MHKTESTPKTEEKTAKKIITACDQGHYGFQSCGSCGATLPDLPSISECPNCHIKLVGTTVSPGFGGSDL